MAAETGFVPFIRSASEQCLIPGTDTQLLHCQNAQPFPSQFEAGTSGRLAVVQCATQRSVPAVAAAVELPRCDFQKFGEV